MASRSSLVATLYLARRYARFACLIASSSAPSIVTTDPLVLQSKNIRLNLGLAELQVTHSVARGKTSRRSLWMGELHFEHNIATPSGDEPTFLLQTPTLNQR